MPQEIRSRVLLLMMLVLTSVSYSQSAFSCLDVDNSGLYKKAYDSFEKDLFEYYNFGKDSIKTYRTFLAEVASLSLDLRKLPSENSIQLARIFKKKSNSKNSIWVKLSEYESNEANKKTAPNTTATTKGEEEILIFNYRGGLIQCLKNNSDSDDFQNIIRTLENDGNVSTSLIAQRIYYIIDKEFRAPEIKNFIAFDIYFSILIVIEKAFG